MQIFRWLRRSESFSATRGMRTASVSVALEEFPPPGASLRTRARSAWGERATDIALLDRLVASSPGLTASVALEVYGGGDPSELGEAHDDELPGGRLPKRIQIRVTTGYAWVYGTKITQVGHAQEEIDWLSGTVVGLKVFWAPVGTAGGTRATLDRYSMYRDFGLRRVVGFAGAATGGYVWARFGFKTGPKGVSAIRLNALSGLRKLIAEGLMPQQDADGVRAVLEEGGTDLPFRVATLKGQVDGKPLGRALMEGARWLGVFELHDDLAWKQANAFAVRQS